MLNKEEVDRVRSDYREILGYPTKVCILGSSRSTLDQAPRDREDLQFWTLAWRNEPCSDAKFDIHDITKSDRHVPSNYRDWLRDSPVPVILQDWHPDVPYSYRYPLGEVVTWLTQNTAHEGSHTNNNGAYFASSIAYMLALAMFLGVEEIHIYGVDLTDDTEYSYQRPNTEYLIGLARGLGVRVVIPDGSALLTTPSLYGYQDDVTHDKDLCLLPIRVIDERLKAYRQELEKTRDRYHAIDGAIQVLQGLRHSHDHARRGGTIPSPVVNKQEN